MNIINFSNPFSSNNNHSWKLPFKIGMGLIAIGYIIFLLKELIIGFISLIFIMLGIYCLYISYNIWRMNNQSF